VEDDDLVLKPRAPAQLLSIGDLFKADGRERQPMAGSVSSQTRQQAAHRMGDAASQGGLSASGGERTLGARRCHWETPRLDPTGG